MALLRATSRLPLSASPWHVFARLQPRERRSDRRQHQLRSGGRRLSPRQERRRRQCRPANPPEEHDRAGGRTPALRSGSPGQTIDQVRYIGSRIEIYGSLPAIHRAIHAVEAAKPHLFIASAVLKAASPTGKPGAPEEPIIEAQLEVFGATRIEASSR
jgi:hypothetical protein